MIDALALLYLATVQALAHGTRHIVDTMNAHGYRIDTLLATGGARCWGSNGSGQVGNESAADPAKPIDVNVVSGVSLLGAGLDATCALDSTGLLCWGDNADSQLTAAVMEASTSTPEVRRGRAAPVGSALGPLTLTGFAGGPPKSTTMSTTPRAPLKSLADALAADASQRPRCPDGRRA